MLTQLKVIYTLSRSETEGPPFNEFCSIAPALHEFYIMPDKMNAVVVIDPDRRITIHIFPSFGKPDRELSAVFLKQQHGVGASHVGSDTPCHVPVHRKAS